MAAPYIGEIRLVGFTFAPRGWLFCDGSVLLINQNQALFSILGTNYGGDGVTFFNIPDLRGRAPVHVDFNQNLSHGTQTGTETVTLTEAQMPAHTHAMRANSAEAA